MVTLKNKNKVRVIDAYRVKDIAIKEVLEGGVTTSLILRNFCH
jgi:hypothetical protein